MSTTATYATEYTTHARERAKMAACMSVAIAIRQVACNIGVRLQHARSARIAVCICSGATQLISCNLHATVYRSSVLGN
jgi:hypothetical protein